MATAITLCLPLPGTAQEFPYDGNLDQLESWYHERLRQSLVRRDEKARRVAREWQDYLDRLHQERQAQQTRAQQRQDEQRRLAEERQERRRQEEADREAQRAAEAERRSEYQAEQRTLALHRQAERAAEWRRRTALVSEKAGPILGAALALILCVTLVPSLLVLSVWWLTTLPNRYRLRRIHREFERTLASTRRFEQVTATLKRAKAEADAFIEQEARITYQRGRGL